MRIGMAHTLAFTHWHSKRLYWGLAWCRPRYISEDWQWAGMEAVCLFIPMAWAGMGAVCLSPWLTHWHSHTAMGWHGGCLFIAMTHKAVCLSPWLGLAWRLPVYHHGSQGCLFIAMAWAGMEAVCLSPWLTHWHSHTGIYTLAFNEVPMGIGMVHTLAFTHWHGGCLFIALAHTLAWRLSVYRHGSHTGIGLAWRLRVYRHGSHTGMEAVCGLSLAWRLSVYRHGSHTGIGLTRSLAFEENNGT